MTIDMGKQSKYRETCPRPQCPLQIPYGLPGDQTQAFMMRRWWPAA